MAGNGLSQTSNGIQKTLDGMVKRSKSLSSYFNRVLFRQFQKAQIERWQTENQSQGSPWKALSSPYREIKRRKFAAYPGGGNAMMIATGKLASGAQARDTSKYRKIVTDSSFIIAVDRASVPYADYPATERPYMKFSPKTLKKWREGIDRYIRTGETS